jgi:hypothetical protein
MVDSEVSFVVVKQERVAPLPVDWVLVVPVYEVVEDLTEVTVVVVPEVWVEWEFDCDVVPAESEDALDVVLETALELVTVDEDPTPPTPSNLEVNNRPRTRRPTTNTTTSILLRPWFLVSVVSLKETRPIGVGLWP